MSDMVTAMGSALITNLTASMDPSRKVIVDQLTQMGKRAALDNEMYKDTLLSDLYDRLNAAEAADKRNVSLINSLDRRIKRIEEI